jgi:hypothetical protein
VPKVPLGSRVLREWRALPDHLAPLARPGRQDLRGREARKARLDQKAIQAPRHNPDSKTCSNAPLRFGKASIKKPQRDWRQGVDRSRMRHLFFLILISVLLLAFDAFYFGGRYRSEIWQDAVSEGQAFNREVENRLKRSLW